MSSPLLLLAVRRDLVGVLVVGPARKAQTSIRDGSGRVLRSGDAGARVRAEGRVLSFDELDALASVVSWWGPLGCRWVTPTSLDRDGVLALLPHDELGALVAGNARLPEAQRGRTVRPDEVHRDAWPEAALVVEGMARAMERAALERAHKAAA